jgi:hypothetical protein
MKAIAIGLLAAAASIALSASANAHIWVDGRGWIRGGAWATIGITTAATSGRPPIIIGGTIGFPAKWRATAPAGGGSPAACKPV